ncbi:MAG: lipoyl(octanoyl) transferase LipB [Kiritimatiellia bacterium]
MTAIAIYFDGLQPYRPVAELQLRLVQARQTGAIPDTVLFLEHQAVVTMGRRGRNNFLKLQTEEYARRGIELVTSPRGGDVTWHGPGQLVMYPVIKLGDCEADAHGYLRNLEEIAIRTAADFGVKAFRREGKSGAWTEHGKIAAIGFKVSRWVTSHGMSFNVCPDFSGFDTIVPCGLEGEKVAALQSILGDQCPSLAEVRDSMKNHFENICARPLAVFPSNKVPPALAGLMDF